MALMVTDTYDERQQASFRDGMQKLNDAAFMAATPAQRLAKLAQLDREQKTYMDTRAEGAPPHHFRLINDRTPLGYFSSDIGCTQAVRSRRPPARFDAC